VVLSQDDQVRLVALEAIGDCWDPLPASIPDIPGRDFHFRPDLS
jgi:hypothetical protein